MAAVKLVKHLFMVILFCTEMEHMMGERTDNDEENAPDAHIIYDQRQSGKYNIHVVIKDVAIIEMDQNEIADQNYNDEEYYYDEEDLTVKPLNIKTTSTTVKPLDSFTNDKTTLPSVQTTLESQNLSQESSDMQLSTNFSKPSHEEIVNKETTDAITPFNAHRPSIDTKSRSKVEPIYAIEEPALQPRHHLEELNYNIPTEYQSRGSPLAVKNSKSISNSRIFKVKVHRSHRAPQIMSQRERCRLNQYRDGRGNCRGKRSSSGTILKRLFRMLLTLPFRQDEQQIND